MNIVKHETVEYTYAEMNRLFAVKREFENLSHSVTDPELKTFVIDIVADLDFFISKYTDINIESTINNSVKDDAFKRFKMECANDVNVQINCDGTRGAYD